MHLQIATNFKQEDGKTPSQDVANNQAKYLALLPSLPKLEGNFGTFTVYDRVSQSRPNGLFEAMTDTLGL